MTRPNFAFTPAPETLTLPEFIRWTNQRLRDTQAAMAPGLVLDARDYGITGKPAQDVTTNFNVALQDAIRASLSTTSGLGGAVAIQLPVGTTSLQPDAVADWSGANVKVVGHGIYSSTIRRLGNGTLFHWTAGNEQELSQLRIDVQGTTGPVLSVDDNAFYAEVSRVFVDNVAVGDTPVVIATDAGSECEFARVKFNVLGPSTTAAMIRVGTSTEVDAGPRARTFDRCQAIGSTVPLLDIGGAEITFVQSCISSTILFQTNSRKALVNGCRWATLGAPTTVSGINHAFAGNVFAGPVTFDATTVNCGYAGNVDGGVTDLGAGNKIYA